MSLIVAISGLTDLPAGQIVLDIARDFGRHWILYCTWAGLFVVTVFLLRMLYTRWGESNVTSKAVSLSLLIHLVAGLWTTTVKMAASSSQDTTLEGRIVLREVRIEKPQSPLSSS